MLSDWHNVRKRLRFGFPTKRDSPYAYILGVSLLEAEASAVSGGATKPGLTKPAPGAKPTA
jgi:hypothetical protein